LVTAALGVGFGLGQWVLALIGLALALAVLIVGGPLERVLRQVLTPLADPADDFPGPSATLTPRLLSRKRARAGRWTLSRKR